MWFYYVISWISTVIQVCFVTLSIAAGLYYLAELVEEYSVIAKKVITGCIVFTASAYVGFWLFEDLPLILFVCGLISSVVYFLVIQTFPFVAPQSPQFICGVLLVFVNHYLAFNFFVTAPHTFNEVLTYFTICLWLVPFALIISLTANDNVLPTVTERTPLLQDSDVVTNYFLRKGKSYNLLSLFNYAKESMLPTSKRRKLF